MAAIFNEQRVLGARKVADGTVIFNNQPVIGLSAAADGVLFSANKRTLGVDVLDTDKEIHNEQPVVGYVLIEDGRTLYNGCEVIPASARNGSFTDPLVASIDVSGWTATYSETPPDFLSGAAKHILVQRAGFDADGNATTLLEAIRIIGRLRQPYPNHASPTAVTVALAQRIYAADTAPGLANNSTAVCPKPTVHFRTQSYQRATGASFRVEALASHSQGRAGRMVAAVSFTATGLSSLATVTVTSSVMETSTAPSRSGIAVPVFAASIPLAGFTQGETVEVNLTAFPFVGPAFSTATNGDAFPSPNPSPLRFLCDKADTIKRFATVDPTGTCALGNTAGCNQTGAENTNLSLCYPNIEYALRTMRTLQPGSDLAGCTVLLRDGTYAGFGGSGGVLSTYACTSWATIRRAPSSTGRANCVFTFTATTSQQQPPLLLKFEDVTLTGGTGTNHILLRGTAAGDLTKHLWLDNCDHTGTGDNNPPFYNIAYVSHTNCQLTNLGPAGLRAFDGATSKQYFFSTHDSILDTGNEHHVHAASGNEYRNNTRPTEPGYAYTAITQPSGALVLHNKVFKVAGALANALRFGSYRAYTRGAQLVGNLIEALNGAWPVLSVAADDAMWTPQTGVFLAHNTVIGARTNFLYNDGGGSGQTQSGGNTVTPASDKPVSLDKTGACRFNIFDNWNAKRDTFTDNANYPAGTSGDGGRIGNWAVSHGVGAEGNVARSGSMNGGTTGPTSWLGERFPGLAGSTAAPLALGFVNDQAGRSENTGLTGAGNGDYRLTAGSSALGLVPAGMALLPFDLAGTARRNDGTGAAGAYEG